jgi:hypothetical protein
MCNLNRVFHRFIIVASMACVSLFDLSRYDTWEVTTCLKRTMEFAPETCVKLLVGCKNDLPIDPRFGSELKEIYEFVDKYILATHIHRFIRYHIIKRYHIPFVTCSAKTGAGVEFESVIAMIYASIQSRASQAPTNKGSRCVIQ